MYCRRFRGLRCRLLGRFGWVKIRLFLGERASAGFRINGFDEGSSDGADVVGVGKDSSYVLVVGLDGSSSGSRLDVVGRDEGTSKAVAVGFAEGTLDGAIEQMMVLVKAIGLLGG